MNIIINNLEEAKNYIEEKKEEVFAELVYMELMKHPPEIRQALYKLIMQMEE